LSGFPQIGGYVRQPLSLGMTTEMQLSIGLAIELGSERHIREPAQCARFCGLDGGRSSPTPGPRVIFESHFSPIWGRGVG
jgi:hypothetical protein